MNAARPTVVHLAPHPDDELIGAPACLMALRDAGCTVVNVACGFGAPAHSARRAAELEEACRRAGFVLEAVADPLGDPLSAAEAADAEPALRSAVESLLARHRPAVLVCPSPHDRHPGHEVVGRAAIGAVSALEGTDPGGAARLWLWGLWADLPFPTLAVAFDGERLEEILGALAAHGGELERNDYRRLVSGRAQMQASVGPERVFGFGTEAQVDRYVELVCEVARVEGAWRLGRPRWFDPDDPLPPVDGGDVTGWLASPSLTDRFGPPPLEH